MKCPRCGGTAYAYACEDENGKMPIKCPWCGYSEVQTNEEWFDNLPTIEKAEWLDKVAENCCQICDEENKELCRKNIAIGCKFENAKKWEMWLKQPHTR